MGQVFYEYGKKTFWRVHKFLGVYLKHVPKIFSFLPKKNTIEKSNV